MALYAKSNQVVQAKKLDEDVTIDIGGGEMLLIAAAGDWATWCAEKGFRGFVSAADWEDKWLYVGGA